MAGNVDLLHAFPVLYYPNQLPGWESLPYGVIKELCCCAIDNGISAPFSTGLLETVVDSYTLALHNFRQIARLMLASIQFSVWSQSAELCNIQATDNLWQPRGTFCDLSMPKLLWARADTRQPQYRLDCLWKFFSSQRSSLCGLFVKCWTVVLLQPHLLTGS